MEGDEIVWAMTYVLEGREVYAEESLSRICTGKLGSYQFSGLLLRMLTGKSGLYLIRGSDPGGNLF